MATRPTLHKSDSDPCMTTTSNAREREVILAKSNAISHTVSNNYAQLGHVPAALQMQNQMPAGMTASVTTSRSAGFSNPNMGMNTTNVPDSRYFVSRVQNVGPLSKRRRTPKQHPQQPAGRIPLPDLPLPMQIPVSSSASIASTMQISTHGLMRPSTTQMSFGGLSTAKSSLTPRTPKRKAAEAIGPPVGTHTMPMPGAATGVGGMGMGMGMSSVGRLGGTGMINNNAMGAAMGAGGLRGAGLGAPIISPRVTAPIPLGGPITRPVNGSTHIGQRPMGGIGNGLGMGLGAVNRVPLPNAPMGLGTAPMNLGVGAGGGVAGGSSLGKPVIPAPSALNSQNPDLQPIKGKPKSTRRYRHNATERTRTRVISRKISELGVQMTNAGIKVKKEKLLILNSAVEYVAQLQASCVQHDTSNKQLEEQIAVMTQELEALKVAKKEGKGGDVNAAEAHTPHSLMLPGEAAATSANGHVKIDYEKAFMSQPLPSLLMDHNFGIMSCNWLFLLFVNKTKEMVMGKTLLEILYPNPATKLKNWNTIKESFTKSHSVKLEDSAAVDGVTMRFQMIMSQSTCPGGKGQRIEAVFLPFLPARNPAHDNTLRPIRSWNELHFALV